MFSRFFFLSVLTISVAFVFDGAKAGAVNPDEQNAEQQVAPDSKDEAGTAAEEKAEDENAPAAQMRAAIKGLVENLKPEEMQHFSSIYSNYNMVNTVKTVRRDVTDAIKACGDNNPDMKVGLDSRFEIWGAAVEPVIKESDANINNMVFAQDYAKKEEFKNIFNLIDQTRDYTASKFEKVPVTTPEACNFLLGNMDETQSSMLSLLRAGLVSYPQSTSSPKENP